MSFIHFFSQKLRLSNPWRYKVPLLISFTYVMFLTGDTEGATSAISYIAAIVTIIGFMGFGYLTNDIADRKIDAIAGKSNGAANLSNVKIALLVLFFLTLAIGPWFYLPIDKISVICIISELLLFVLYAFPPFRLKEKGIFGVIADSFYAHVLPGFLASWTFFLVGGKIYDNFFYYAIALSVWQFISGTRNIVSHHYKDFENDQASGTRTFGTFRGKQKIYDLLVRILIPLEVISLFFYLFVVQLEVDFMVIAVIIFVVFAWSNFKSVQGNGAETNAKHFTNEFLDRFYMKWFPIILLLALGLGNLNFWWIVILHCLFFFPFGEKIRNRMKRQIETNENKTELNSRKIAILSVNRKQYSETFIQSHFQLLPNAIVYSDGYLPQSVSLDRGETWTKLSEKESTESDLIHSWKTNGVEVVLAEYGLAGVEVMEICEEAKIPLIVHFHGFDAYRDDVLQGIGKKYPVLFKKAAKIIVVSQHMRNQLINLGCPKEKLVQITYGIDTDLFTPDPTIETRKNFIACGRFVSKKSPLNTIRAFALVNKKYPETRLTFIGDGELLDASIELSKELGVSQNIDFKGVLSHEGVASEMQKHAIFVQHSVRSSNNDSEGTPLSVLEAASCGLATVSTRHGGIIDVLIENESGLLVDEGDIHAMAEQMIRLYEDPIYCQKIGHSARKRILENYKSENYISELNKQLQQAQSPIALKTESKWDLWKYRAITFVVFFLLVEIGLRFVGFKPGVIDDFYFHRGFLKHDAILYGDERGITHLTQDAQIITDNIINEEGFLSDVEFTQRSIEGIRKSGRKIVMLIGDSYTQGCCADSYSYTFASLLNQSGKYEVLNFGIPGADPLQYRLIVEKYAKIIHPDLIVVAVYGGNDIMEYARKARPNIPSAYPIKEGPWLNSEGPIYLTKKGTYFKSFEEAKRHYFEYFSLWSDQSSFFEKNIRYSVIFSRIYLKWKTMMRFKEVEYQVDKTIDKPIYTYNNLSSLLGKSKEMKIPVLFSLIPSPNDVVANVDLRKKYAFLFGEIEWFEPKGLSLSDYDGSGNANHFNNEGHRKYSIFMRNLIEEKLLE